MGFDNECILNIQSLAGEYFCPVCRLLVYPNEALQSQCTHLYCKPCLTYVVGTTRACPYDGYLVTEADSKPLTESNKALAETIGKIAVHCLYHRSGCTWQGPLSDCTSHCSGCAFGNSPVVCNRCGIQIVHSQVQEHAQNCPGVQSQTQQAEGVQEGAAAGVALSIDQNQGATQVGTATSQAQPSQTTTATTPVQDPNQQANPNPQVQAVQPAVPTPEQLYQQQQYQQYYQQYPGYDPYQQQYQQYYPYQQQAVQQYQQQPTQVPPQHTAQSYVQSQPQPQLQPQVQAQLQAQPQPQPQPQPQSQPHPHVQAPAAAQHQNHQVTPPQQLHPAAHPHSQIQPQSHPPAHGNPPPQPQLYPQAQPHLQSQPMQPPPQSYPMQPHSQQVLQIPQYQQHHSQMQQPQPQIQPQPHSQQHPLPQTTPHSQAQPQPQLQHHPQPQPQLHPSQPNQPPHNVQPPVQHQSAHAVSGHQSYQQPQPQHQMPFIAPQQHSMVMNPQSGPNQQPQHPVQMQTQFPQQTAQMRPPQSHAPIPNQQPPVLLPMPGQGATIPSAQQQQIHPHAHHPGHPVHHRPVMQPNQQPMPQQYVQQQQFPFPGLPTSSTQNQLNKQGAFYQHQQQLPMQSQLRPQAPSLLQQHSSAQPQLTAAFSHGTQPHQSQNQVVRPMFPNHGVQSQPLPQSPGGLGGASQVRPMQLGANQQSMSQNYPIRTNNQNQALSEQQLGPMQPLSQSQIGRDQLSEKNEGGSDEKSTKINANNFIASGSGDDSVEIKTVKYENDTNPTNFEDKKSTGHAGRSAGEVPESVRSLGIDSEVNALEQKDSVIKHVVKEEAIEGTLEPSAGGKSVANVGEDQTDVTNITPIHVEQHLLKEKEQADNLDEQSRNLHKDGVDNGGIVQPSRGDDKNTKAVPAAVTPGSDSSSQISGNFLSQSQVPRGSGVDESRGFPPPSQVQGRGFVQSSHPIPFIDQGRHPPPPTHYGPSAPSMLHAVPPGPPHHGQGPGLPPTQLRPQGPGYLGQTGQPLNHPDHFQSLGRGPSHSGPPQRSFEQLVAPQEFYNQGRMGPSHAGAPRTSQGESVGGPPAPFDAHGGMVARAPPHGPEGLMGQQRPNPLDGEMILSQRRGYLDGRQPDLPNMMRLNGPPGLESSYAPGMRDDRFKPLPGEHTNQFPMEQSRRMIERGEFQDDLKQFPRPSHLDADPKFGGYLSSSRPVDNRGPQAFGMDAIPRPLDMPPYGLNYDTGMKLDPSASAAPSRNLPFSRPNDTGERSRPVGFHEDNMGRPEFSHTRPDFLGQVSRYGRHHMDGSPVREYPGLPSRGFGPGVPGVQSGLDIDGRESLRFGDGAKPFNRHSDPIGSFHETGFPMPPHLRRGEHDGPLSLRINEMIGQDVLPGHLRRDDPLGPRNLPSHLRMGEPGFGPFSGHARIGELAGPGNFPPRFGEPGFRSSYTLQDSGFYKGNMESFDNPRKRKPTSMGWCRICKVDCETMEGLDLHSQTREHQDMAMDMVLNIKQQNAKKKKLISNDHSVVEDASKSKSASFESRRNRH